MIVLAWKAWLKHIRELRAAGRSAESVQILLRFHIRYPDVVLPDDLRNCYQERKETARREPTQEYDPRTNADF